MSKIAPRHPNVITYNSYADTCPPKLELYKIIDSPSEGIGPYLDREHLLVTAHACGDLIMKYTQTKDHARSLGTRARSIMKTIVNSGIRLQQRLPQEEKLKPTLMQISPYIVQAMLQMPEIGLWKACVADTAPGNIYRSRLEAAYQAVHFPQSRRATVTIMNAMPLLLGARARYQGNSGWAGRLALTRESQQPNGDDIRQKWETGICLPDMTRAHGLLLPMRVKVAATDQRKDRYDFLYHRAGIACISAEECGFDDPAQVVLSCLNEFEPTPAPEGTHLLHSEQLDALTQGIETNIRKEYERAVTAEQDYQQLLQTRAADN